ncbi:MAG: hypothetical protein VKK04_17065 [Synechococcales bacterium]|nr:hypothetical protein [Synechococcales bacterium]
MSTYDQARALMTRHHHTVKNRQQAMLGRLMSEAGMPAEEISAWNHIQGKPYTDARASYDRSRAALS